MQNWIWGGVLALGCLWAGTAAAQSCTTTQYPYTLTNGSTADASQVTADLNCAAIYGLAHWTGNVGIGGTNPLSRLEVDTNSSQTTDGVKVVGSDGHAILLWPSTSAGSPNPIVQAGDQAIIFTNSAVNTGALDITAWANNAAGLRLTAAGVVSVDTASPTSGYVFYVNGAAAGTSGFATASDARLKKDITPVTGALALVEKLQGVHYRWRPASERTVGRDMDLPVDKPQIGFIAQAVEKVVPEAVDAPKPGSNEVYDLKESKLIPLLVEAIKEQQAEIRKQQAEIEALRKAIRGPAAATTPSKTPPGEGR